MTPPTAVSLSCRLCRAPASDPFPSARKVCLYVRERRGPAEGRSSGVGVVGLIYFLRLRERVVVGVVEANEREGEALLAAGGEKLRVEVPVTFPLVNFKDVSKPFLLLLFRFFVPRVHHHLTRRTHFVSWAGDQYFARYCARRELVRPRAPPPVPFRQCPARLPAPSLSMSQPYQ